MGNKLLNVATTEAHQPLGNAFRKIGRTWHSLADLDQAQAISECVILGDSLGYQGLNARSAKETLQMRTGVLEEYQAAVKTSISKRRQIERLKASSNIRPERVDEALEELKEANKYEQVLAKRAEGISQNLHRALETHNNHVNEDVTAALIEHARSSIMYERQLLRELEALRSDVANAANKVVPSTNVPKPTVILPLEEPIRPLPPPAPTPMPTGSYRQETPPPPRMQTPPRLKATLPASSPSDPLASGPTGLSSQPPISPSPSHQTFASRGSISTSSSFASRQGQFSPSIPPSPRQPLPAQSPGAGPSTPTIERFSDAKTPLDDGPPLGGRFGDGTKSMFVNNSSPLVPPSPSSPTFNRGGGDPLMGSGAPVRPSSALDGNRRGMNGHPALQNDLDPLGLAKPTYMSSSVRVQPTRPRLDAKEAASKLANMF